MTEKLNKFITGLDEKGVQIIEKNVRIEPYDKMWILRGTFLVHEVSDING